VTNPRMPRIDLRSDTLSPSTPAMYEAMASARLGMASRGEDEQVLRLEAHGANLLGTETAAFLPNVTSANLLALLAQAPRGSAVLMDRMAHINQVEWYGITVFGGTVPWLLEGDRGHLDAAAIEAACLDRNGGRNPVVGALVLENTHNFAGGTVIGPQETGALAAAAHRHGAAVHLDGARLPNAAAALGIPMATLTRGVDTVAISLTKALSAPYGALLGGPRDVVERAREIGHHVGFGRFHRAGQFAAAGLVALDTMLDRLPEDHRRARLLAEALARLDGLEVDLATVQSNIVNIRLQAPGADAVAFAEALAGRDVGLLPFSGGRLRAVTHHAIADAAIREAVDAIAATLRARVAKR
jgi:threonine aldolase